MTLLILCTIALLTLAMYFSALNLALIRQRRSMIERRLEESDRGDEGAWLIQQREPIVIIVGLLRTIARVGVFAGVLLAFYIDREAPLFDVRLLLWSALIAIPLLWFFTTVLADAIARYAGVGLIARSIWLLRAIGTLGYPLAHALMLLDTVIRRLFGADENERETHRNELLRSIEDTQREGALAPDAAAMLENVVQFTHTDVSEIMTPRTEIDAIELSQDLASIRKFISDEGHSRLPVFEEDLDHIRGVLYVKDLIRYLGAQAPDFKLLDSLRQPIFVPETKPVSDLLRNFQQSEVHMAIVVDEYGGTAGLVTIEDVLEEIVGEIHDEHDPDEDAEPTIVKGENGVSEVDGRFHIHDLNSQLGLSIPESADYDTVAGFVLASLGRVPRAGEQFESHNARFTAIDVTATQVMKIGIEVLEPVAEATNGRKNGHPSGHE